MKRIILTIAGIFVAIVVLVLLNEQTEVLSVHKELTTENAKTVHVYFFEGFDQSLGEVTINELKQIFDSVAFEGVIPFPDSAYYAPRSRYRADKLIRHIRTLQSSPSELVIGFSSKDISCRVHGYEDFGVMGLTIIPLYTAVVSTYRLKVKSRLQSDFLKITLHELGHADGLHHCKNDVTCYMRDANGQNHFPELDGFCERCEEHLLKRGWKF